MARQILVVDDDKTTRFLLSQFLQDWDYEVVTASDGLEAWNILQQRRINFVITDWMMPRLDGLELCRRIRAADFPSYIYVMLLTTRESRNEVVDGIAAGADDFVVKPPSTRELLVRIRAGERILKLETDLEERNRKLRESNKKLSEAYLVIKNDLEAAAKIQSSLLPESASIIYGVQFDWIFLPCTFVAGDIFNYFKLDAHHIGFYLLDVAGHGIPAAMLSVSLSRILSPATYQEGIINPNGLDLNSSTNSLTSPASMVQALNHRFQFDDDTMQYFTMTYGIIDSRDGRTSITQAGQPLPILLRNGEAFNIGSGGYPVGLLPDLDYEEEEIHLKQGDRLILYSDGITECANQDGEQFSVERLMRLVEEDKTLTLHELLGRIEQRVRRWKGNDEFEDDITLLGMEIV